MLRPVGKESIRTKLIGLSEQVGDLSPKGRSAKADSDLVFGQQLVLPTGFLSDFRPNTGASRLSPTRWWVKALR
jgi:hypothetical protein